MFSVEKLVVANEHLLVLHVNPALRVLDLVDRDGNDAEDEEECRQNGSCDHARLQRVLSCRDVIELVDERFLISGQSLTEVIERPGCTVDWVEIGEGRDFFLIRNKGLTATNDHEDGGVFDRLIHVA